MEIPLRKLDKPHINDFEAAAQFAKRLHDEFGRLVRGIVLFRSKARSQENKGDIDIMVIIDDLRISLSKEVVETYRIIVEKLVLEISEKLHVTSLRFTTFWEYVRSGDPVAVNILRDGIALLDTGFFDPLQMLLKQGRIRPSSESVTVYFNRAPRTLNNSKYHLLQATVDLYWAVIDAAHAALMKYNEVPPSPEQVSELLTQRFVNTNMIDSKYPHIMKIFYSLAKQIERREIKEITGAQYDQYLSQATMFVDQMKKLIQ